MKTSAIIRIIIYSLIVFLLTTFLVDSLTDTRTFWDAVTDNGFGFSWRWGDRHRGFDDTNYQSGGTSIAVGSINEIEINWVAGNIKFEVHDGDQIIFAETARTKITDEKALRYAVYDNKLIIDFSRNMRGPINIGNNMSKSLLVKIPKAMILRKLDIENVSSDIDLGSFSCRSLSISSVSGEISGSGIVADNLNCETVSGDIELEGSFKVIDHESVSGDVKITSDVCPDKVDGEAISGKIELYIPENDGFTVDYDKVSGNVNCDFPVTSGKDRITYKNGNSKFDYSTISGNIYIKQK